LGLMVIFAFVCDYDVVCCSATGMLCLVKSKSLAILVSWPQLCKLLVCIRLTGLAASSSESIPPRYYESSRLKFGLRPYSDLRRGTMTADVKLLLL
jgi:hypothetical protein